MPRISHFYGIVIYMYRSDHKQHHLPHIHARYQSNSASVAIEDCRVLDNSLPPSKLRMVQAWVDIHREELLADWELALGEQTLFEIKPLE